MTKDSVPTYSLWDKVLIVACIATIIALPIAVHLQK